MIFDSVRHLLRPENKRIGPKLVRNALFSGLRLFVLAPLPIVVVPFFLKKLGTGGYGTWAILLAIGNMTSLADLGLVTSVSKHVAEFYTKKDSRSLSRLVNTGLVIYVIIAFSIAGILWTGSGIVIAGLFKGSSLSPGELLVLWHYLLLLVIANIVALLFTSVAIGLQRMDVSATLAIINTLASSGTSILLLHFNWGIRGAVLAYVWASWVTLCAYIYVLHKLLPEVAFNPIDCDLHLAKQILRFSITTYITSVASVIHNQIEKLYLARFVGVGSAGWYDISSDLAVKLRAVPGFVLAPVMPAAAELSAQRDEQKVDEMYHRTHKYLAVVGVPFVCYVAFASRRFVELWVGPKLSVIAVPLSLLLIVNFINLMTGPGFLVFTGEGRLRPGLYSALLGITLNLSLSFFLIRAYGFEGAVIGTSLSLTIASAFFLYLYQSETGTSFLGVVRRMYLKPLACSLLLITVLWVLVRNQPASWTGLLLYGLLFGIVYVLLLLLAQFFDSLDAEILRSLLPVFRMTRKALPGA